eukprot:1648692-Prymnesium_polylepis.1
MRAAHCTLTCSHLGGGLSVRRFPSVGSRPRTVRMLVDHVGSTANMLWETDGTWDNGYTHAWTQ